MDRKQTSKRVAVLFGALAAGCSGSPQSDFVGTWTPTSGTTTLTCGGAVTTSALPANQSDSWVSGPDDGLTLTNEFGSLTATVSDRIASAASAGTWLEAFPGTGAASASTGVADGTVAGAVQVTRYTFTLSADGQTATETFGGTAVVTENNAVVTCAVDESATYEKMAK